MHSLLSLDNLFKNIIVFITLIRLKCKQLLHFNIYEHDIFRAKVS